MVRPISPQFRCFCVYLSDLFKTKVTKISAVLKKQE